MQSLSQNPKDPEFLKDPTAFYDRAREFGEVFFWQEYGMPCATSYAAVMQVLKDRKLARVPPDGFPPAKPNLAEFARSEARSLLNLEPPDHTRLRKHLLRAFTASRISGLAPEIEALCHELLDKTGGDPFDILPAYANQVPVLVIARLLGVPESMANQFLDWSHAIVRMYTPAPTAAEEEAANSASAAFLDYLDRTLSRGATDEDTLLNAFLRLEESQEISREDSLCTCILLLNAGHEATVHALGNAVVTLLHTGQAPQLTSRKTVEATVEECLRINPPLHLFTRWVQDDVEIGSNMFRRGDEIACLLGAGNHDPSVFTNPKRFLTDRPATTITSFGAGIHFCLGAPLARLEMAIALRVLFERFPGLMLQKAPEQADIYHFRGYDEVWVSEAG